jgi:small subunit ribosomal protein S9
VSFGFRPESRSYFTGNSVYNDNLLALERIVRKHSKLPELPLGQYPKTYWRTIEQYRELDTTSHVRPTDHKKLLQLLNRLNRIDRAYMPKEVLETMAYYTRERLGSDPVKKDLKPDTFGRTFGVGRRKESVARVWVVPGKGELFINGRPLDKFVQRPHDKESILLPLDTTQRLAQYNIWAYVDGGGTTGQAEAIQLGMAKALVIHEPELKPVLRKAGCITADSRRVERKKTGKPKARKSYTWVKR